MEKVTFRKTKTAPRKNKYNFQTLAEPGDCLEFTGYKPQNVRAAAYAYGTYNNIILSTTTDEKTGTVCVYRVAD